MMQPFLAGELSLTLARLLAVVTNEAHPETARLRRLAETVPIAVLIFVLVRALVRALGLINNLCWESLQCRDLAAFTRQGALGADLCDVSVCSCLIGESFGRQSDTVGGPSNDNRARDAELRGADRGSLARGGILPAVGEVHRTGERG